MHNPSSIALLVNLISCVSFYPISSHGLVTTTAWLSSRKRRIAPSWRHHLLQNSIDVSTTKENNDGEEEDKKEETKWWEDVSFEHGYVAEKIRPDFEILTSMKNCV